MEYVMTDYENLMRYLNLKKIHHTVSESFDGYRVVLVLDDAHKEITSYVYDNDGYQIKEIYHDKFGYGTMDLGR